MAIVCALFLCLKTTAQTDSMTVHTLNGKEYYIHTIEPGNTLYFISKRYNTPVEVIQNENPSVLDGLSIGEKVFIPLKKNEVSEDPINGNYILHTVEKGRTLYSLAKEYNLNQKDIVALNPEIVDEGIQEGQVLKIPVNEIRAEEPLNLVPLQHYKTHLVQSGETLYSLSKFYNVSIDSIQLVNNGLKEGLKVGETINISPLKNSVPSLTTNTMLTAPNQIVDSLSLLLAAHDTILKKPLYKIALLLPFYIEENQELANHLNALESRTIYPKSKFAIELYHGIVLALDSLSNKEVSYQLNVYDTKGQDSNTTRMIVQKKEMQEMDLIIGPLYYSNFEYVAAFAKQHQIPIVSPVKQNNKILLGNQYVFKTVSSKASIVKNIAKLVVDSFSMANLIAIEHLQSNENILVDTYIKEYHNLLMTKKDTLIYAPIKKLNISHGSEIISQLKPNINNVLFVPSTNPTFITNLFSTLTNTLYSKQYKNYTITLIGLEDWEQFESIDLEYFQTLNVHLPVQQFINYSDEETKQVIAKYTTYTNTYPSTTALLGFDIGMYFGKKLKDNGTVFMDNKLKDHRAVSLQFNFFKTGIESGFENIHSTMVKFKDYHIQKVF